MEVEIMEEFPLLSSWKEHKYWTGFLSSQSRLIRLAVNVPNFPSSHGILLEGDNETIQIIQPYKKQIQSVIDSEASVLDFLRKVRSIIEEHIKHTETDESSTSALGNSPEFYTTLFGELELIGPHNVENASSNFGELSIKCYDEKNRKHILRLNIPSQYPKVSVKVLVDLPCPPDSIIWHKKVLDVYNQFKTELEKYAQFWDAVDELDDQTRVIDPIQPNRSNVHRKILINPSVLVNIVIYPSRPRGFPELTFSGPEQAIEDFEKLLNKYCKKWSESNTILENLEEILQCEFMPKQNANGSEGEDAAEATCVICYSLEFEGKMPETICECGSVYHEKCLSDLLVNDCSSKAIRYIVDCPVCGLEIKVSTAKITGW